MYKRLLSGRLNTEQELFYVFITGGITGMKNTGRNVRLHQQYRRKKRKRRKKRVLTEAVFLMAAISVVCFDAILIVLFFCR